MAERKEEKNKMEDVRMHGNQCEVEEMKRKQLYAPEGRMICESRNQQRGTRMQGRCHLPSASPCHVERHLQLGLA